MPIALQGQSLFAPISSKDKLEKSRRKDTPSCDIILPARSAPLTHRFSPLCKTHPPFHPLGKPCLAQRRQPRPFHCRFRIDAPRINLQPQPTVTVGRRSWPLSNPLPALSTRESFATRPRIRPNQADQLPLADLALTQPLRVSPKEDLHRRTIDSLQPQV